MWLNSSLYKYMCVYMYVYIFRSSSNPGLQMTENFWDQQFSLHVNNHHTWKHLVQFELSSQYYFPFSLCALKLRLTNLRIRFWGSKKLKKNLPYWKSMSAFPCVPEVQCKALSDCQAKVKGYLPGQYLLR